ncbi:ABC transporter ATP-binding protein [bacterium]|nr:ABC transporter ATP-binding protein [bacterium]
MSVKLVNISKIFGDQGNAQKKVVAVNDVNLEIKDGEMVTLLGPSGCGKTTTLRIVSGFETPTTGEVWISGKMVNSIPPNKRDTSMVFQSYAIFPHLSVAQNIGFGLELKGWEKKKIEKEVRRIMEIMEFPELYNRRPEQLSGGQQQRVALARAIINKPSVLLFDEPLSNLDAKLRVQMRMEIRKIQKAFSITSIYVTHDQEEALTISDRIVVMNEGKIMQAATPIEIYSYPKNRFVADFIGRVNFLPGKIIENKEKTLLIDFGICQKEIKSRYGDFKVNESVIIVVRPESLKMSSGEKKDPHFIQGEINKLVYLGPTIEYEIEVKGLSRKIFAVTYNPIEEGFFEVGDLVNIDFKPIAAHILSQKDKK